MQTSVQFQNATKAALSETFDAIAYGNLVSAIGTVIEDMSQSKQDCKTAALAASAVPQNTVSHKLRTEGKSWQATASEFMLQLSIALRTAANRME